MKNNAPPKTSGSRLVPTSRFHEYVPGETPIHVDKSYWNGLGLNIFQFPSRNEGVPAPGIPDYGLAYILRGRSRKAYHSVSDSDWVRHQFRDDVFQLQNKECNQCWQWEALDEASPPMAINLLVDSELMQKIAIETFDVCPLNIELQNLFGVQDNLMAELCKALKTEAENQTPFGKIYGESAAQLLAVHLLRNYCTFTVKPPSYKDGLSFRQLGTVREYIDAHLSHDISLETLADLCGLSAYHFSRLFKISMGTPPHQYLMRQRMEKAAQLLKYTRLPVLNISLEVGYQNQSHFSALFKRCYGVTPSEYRRKLELTPEP